MWIVLNLIASLTPQVEIVEVSRWKLPLSQFNTSIYRSYSPAQCLISDDAKFVGTAGSLAVALAPIESGRVIVQRSIATCIRASGELLTKLYTNVPDWSQLSNVKLAGVPSGVTLIALPSKGKMYVQMRNFLQLPSSQTSANETLSYSAIVEFSLFADDHSSNRVYGLKRKRNDEFLMRRIQSGENGEWFSMIQVPGLDHKLLREHVVGFRRQVTSAATGLRLKNRLPNDLSAIMGAVSSGDGKHIYFTRFGGTGSAEITDLDLEARASSTRRYPVEFYVQTIPIWDRCLLQFSDQTSNGSIHWLDRSGKTQQLLGELAVASNPRRNLLLTYNRASEELALFRLK